MSEVTAVPIRPVRQGHRAQALARRSSCSALAAAGLAWVGTQPLQVHDAAFGRALPGRSPKGSGPAMTTADVAALHYKLHVNGLDAPVIQDSDESGQPFVTTVQEVFPGFADALVHIARGRPLSALAAAADPRRRHRPAGRAVHAATTRCLRDRGAPDRPQAWPPSARCR